MGKFKDLVNGKRDIEKDRIDEAVGGVISTPAINNGSGVANGRKGNASGDSRIDTGGEFTYNAGELKGFSGSTRSKPNPKQSFKEGGSSGDLVLHEDDGGSVVLRETGGGYSVIVRAGSQEKEFELEEGTERQIKEFFR